MAGRQVLFLTFSNFCQLDWQIISLVFPVGLFSHLSSVLTGLQFFSFRIGVSTVTMDNGHKKVVEMMLVCFFVDVMLLYEQRTFLSSQAKNSPCKQKYKASTRGPNKLAPPEILRNV